MFSYRHVFSMLVVGIILLCSLSDQKIFGITFNSRNNPDPMYTTQDPEEYLVTRTKNRLKGLPIEIDYDERINISLTVGGQNATQGTPVNGVCNAPTGNGTFSCTELGDLNGKWDMIALLYGPLPIGQTLPPQLTTARSVLFPTVPAGAVINDPNQIDPNQQYGFFSIPAKYRTVFVRVEANAQIVGGLGAKLQGGFSNIRQTVTAFNDQTPNTDSTTPPACPIPSLPACGIKQQLTDQLPTIAAQIGLDICNFNQTSMEDVRAIAYWRQVFDLNENRPQYPRVLVMPFLELGGTLAVGKPRKWSQAFGLSFGNNDHNSVGISAGIDLDFTQTIEIGARVGYTHFFKRDFCDFRVPTSIYQSGIYPFATNVSVQPGGNVDFAAKMSVYHFLDNLSFYFQYVLIQHRDNETTLKTPDPAFMPELIDCKSNWKVQLANASFNYDISPNIALGFLWQIPLSQRNAFKSTTVMFSFTATY